MNYREKNIVTQAAFAYITASRMKLWWGVPRRPVDSIRNEDGRGRREKVLRFGVALSQKS